MKKYRSIFIILITLVISIILLVRLFSFNLALKYSGYDSKDINVFQHSYDINKDEFKVITTRSKQKDIVIVLLTKNKWGFWKITSFQENKDPETNVISFKWLLHGGAKRFEFTTNTKFEKEWHTLYSGTNAIKLIEFYSGQIPENVTVNIQQAGNQYFIHLISFADAKLLNNINIPEIMIENGCISGNND